MLRVPALGIALAWPLLFFVPGLPARQPHPARAGHAGSGRPVGHRQRLRLGASGLPGRPAVWRHQRPGAVGDCRRPCYCLRFAGDHRAARSGSAPPPRPGRVARPHSRVQGAARCWRPSPLAVVGGVWLYGAWHLTSEGWVAGGWNWSDLLVHTSISQSILDGNFPPQVPYFSGAPLLYHWFADFHAALATATSGIDIITVFGLVAGFMAGTFVLLVWALAEALTGNRRVALIAARWPYSAAAWATSASGSTSPSPARTCSSCCRPPRTTTSGRARGLTSASRRCSARVSWPIARRPLGCRR